MVRPRTDCSNQFAVIIFLYAIIRTRLILSKLNCISLSFDSNFVCFLHVIYRLIAHFSYTVSR